MKLFVLVCVLATLEFGVWLLEGVGGHPIDETFQAPYSQTRFVARLLVRVAFAVAGFTWLWRVVRWE